MKIAIICHSESGNTERVASLIAEGAREVGGVEARCMKIDAVEDAFVAEARAVVLGCPVYAGSLSWQMKKWLDTMPHKLAGKLGSVFATANHIGGGAEAAELAMAGGLLVRGCLVYAAGASEGQPYTHFGAVTIRDGDDKQKERARIFGGRVARKALELWPEGRG
jgi:NAD(P)H dehydrogenase (quinone)